MILTSCTVQSEEEKLEMIMYDEIEMPLEITEDIYLLERITFNLELYDIAWTSSDPDTISVEGHVKRKDKDIKVHLEATVQTKNCSKTITYEVIVMKREIENTWIKEHQYLAFATSFDISRFDDLKIENGKLQLADNHLEGFYESDEIDSKAFSKMVGSWSAISSLETSVELQVRVMVNDRWSKYLSYKPWGFGKNNFSMNSGDQIAKISIDEIVILNDKKANKFQYKILLKRSKTEIPSPKLDLVSFALTITDYHYRPNIDQLPNHVDYDVPLLNQQSVPDIGNHICSPTSAAMLLLYKGHDLYLEDELPQRYIAQRFRDYGANIYGNWVFNTVGMSSYHEKAYVGMMYSFEELMMHLANVGPVAASVSGDMGLYHTSGHLIVVRGYRITDRGDIYVLVNDPNINSRFGDDKNGDPLYVYYEFPLETFMKTWKGIVYIIE